MIDAHRIVWQGLDSFEFDVTTHCSFGGSSGTTSSFLNRDNIYTEHYDGHRTIHRSKYSEAFTPHFTLIKKDFSDFTEVENRKILSWLTASDTPGFLNVYKDDSEVISWRCFGNPTNIEQYKLGNSRVVGYEFDFESTHPYAWSPKFIYPEVHADISEISNNLETNDYLVVSEEAEFKITCNTDEYNKPLYPRITIKFSGQNPYFPIKINPIEDTAYPMVPNVIYSWTEKYRRATDYKVGTTYYSDQNGTKANPQPTSATEITNGKYYIYVNQEHLYINLNGTEDNGRYEIQANNGNPPDVTTTNSSQWSAYKYYYFPDAGNTIQKLVVTQSDNVATYTWKSVTIVGMAVKISNTYVSIGENLPTTVETIVAGGAMDQVIVLDGTNKIISEQGSSVPRIIGDNFNLEWLPFVYGDNNITVMGNCQIKFEWLEPRKVGSL